MNEPKPARVTIQNLATGETSQSEIPPGWNVLVLAGEGVTGEESADGEATYVITLHGVRNPMVTAGMSPEFLVASAAAGMRDAARDFAEGLRQQRHTPQMRALREGSWEERRP